MSSRVGGSAPTAPSALPSLSSLSDKALGDYMEANFGYRPSMIE
jgi:hypothetical protein